MTTKYANTKLRTLSFEGGTTSDKAIHMWNKMDHLQRYAVMHKVKDFKSSALKDRACVNYIADFMLEDAAINEEFKPFVIRRLAVEKINIGDDEAARKSLSKCVMGSRLTRAYNFLYATS